MAGAQPVSGVSHVAICVRDVEKTLRFYRDLIGLEVIKDEIQDTSSGALPHLYRDQHKQRRVVHIRTGGETHLVFTEHPGEQVGGEPIMLDQVGLSHLSLIVPNVEAMTEHLIANGAETCGPADAWRGPDGRVRTVFFRDPDGILVQFDEGFTG